MNRYIHIHVPKTAGSMLRGILQRNLRGEVGAENILASYIKYSRQDMRRILDMYPYRCFTSHVYALEGIPFDEFENLHSFTFVRNPIEKIVSTYNYLKHRPDTSSKHPAKNMTLSEFCGQELSDTRFDSFRMDSSQVDWLVGRDKAAVGVVEKYIDHGHLKIFPTERFDEACVIMENLWSSDFVDCSYAERRNASVGRKDMSDSEASLVSSIKFMERDLALHKLAHEKLDELIQSLFKSPVEFDRRKQEFFERCSVKREKLRRRERVDKFVARLRSVILKTVAKF